MARIYLEVYVPAARQTFEFQADDGTLAASFKEQVVTAIHDYDGSLAINADNAHLFSWALKTMLNEQSSLNQNHAVSGTTLILA